MPRQQLAPALDAVAADLVAWRRHLHRNPEISFQEVNTSNYIHNQLATMDGLELSRPTATSVMARLVGARSGPGVAIRADIDALPINEENGFEFVSREPGVMHACGHDGHTAMLLGAARILSELRDGVAGEIRFLFQHAEELPPGGAREMIAAGVMDGVHAVIGCHLWAPLETGKVAISDGAVMAAVDNFTIRIEGSGGHAGMPQDTVDPILTAAEVITNLQHIVSRRTDPLSSLVISVTRLAGGSSNNIIPQTVELAGTIRTLEPDVREFAQNQLEQVVRGIAQAHSATVEIEYVNGYDAVTNDGLITRTVAEAIRAVVGEEALIDQLPVMGGDDFSAFQREAPGAYFFVGARNRGADKPYPHHHPRFSIDESALRIGTGVLVYAALSLLDDEHVAALQAKVLSRPGRE